MLSSVWITNTTINERIEHQQNCNEQEADHRNNLLASLDSIGGRTPQGLLVRPGRRIRAMPQKMPGNYGCFFTSADGLREHASAGVSTAPKLVAHASVLSFCRWTSRPDRFPATRASKTPCKRLACKDSFGGAIGFASTYRRGAGKRVSWRKLWADRRAWLVGDLQLGDDRLVHGQCFSSVPG
jgi:hypothetical protein